MNRQKNQINKSKDQSNRTTDQILDQQLYYLLTDTKLGQGCKTSKIRSKVKSNGQQFVALALTKGPCQ